MGSAGAPDPAWRAVRGRALWFAPVAGSAVGSAFFGAGFAEAACPATGPADACDPAGFGAPAGRHALGRRVRPEVGVARVSSGRAPEAMSRGSQDLAGGSAAGAVDSVRLGSPEDVWADGGLRRGRRRLPDDALSAVLPALGASAPAPDVRSALDPSFRVSPAVVALRPSPAFSAVAWGAPRGAAAESS
ncbi:hypothetical protein, partial [Nocardia lijiangensis]|uniref:hypothetical protein n=1 Tax=Nocardia lijiangensis TaxID=299618 RepID=UPI000AC020ED